MRRRGLVFEKKDRFVITRGKHGNDSSESLRNAVEMLRIECREGSWKKTWPRRTKSLIVRSLRSLFS
jgi:hypothetical protein